MDGSAEAKRSTIVTAERHTHASSCPERISCSILCALQVFARDAEHGAPAEAQTSRAATQLPAEEKAERNHRARKHHQLSPPLRL